VGGAKSNRLDHVVSVRIPDALHDRLYAAAKACAVSVGSAIRHHLESEPLLVVDTKSGQPISADDFARMAKAAGVLKRTRPPKSSEEKARVVHLVNKASNNLNQIARRLHTAHATGLAERRAYDTAMRTLVALDAYLRSCINHVD
jgi:hypothetical protein